MWKCSRCGETVDADMDVCWSCGTSKDGVPDPNFFKGELEPAPENLPMPDPAPVSEDENLEPLVTVAQYTIATEGHAARIHLESAGIPVFMADELTTSTVWPVSNAAGGIKVQVPASYQDQALEIIGEVERKREEQREAGGPDDGDS